ncbi:SEL1-like repeat protein [Gallibacterium anatis]|uniref:SEL1-like repeat protein n=1 Tax=Gallibacterium anatis TaxID=750 RepID=UPI00068B79E8|nr:SEL1-like repeat protein [Gallibacterium anatis]
MYCRYCGHQINEDQTYCGYCGKMQNSPANATSSSQSSQKNESSHYNPAFAINNVTLRDRFLALSAELFLNPWLCFIGIIPALISIINNGAIKDTETVIYILFSTFTPILLIRPLFYHYKKQGIFGFLLGITLKNKYNQPISLKKYLFRILIKSILLFIFAVIFLALILAILAIEKKSDRPILTLSLLPFIGYGGLPFLIYVLSFFIQKETIPHLFYDKWLNTFVEKTTPPKYGRIATHAFIIINLTLFTLINLNKSGLLTFNNNIKTCIDSYDRNKPLNTLELAAKPCLAAENSNNSEVQWRLGILYDWGKGVPQDYQKAKYYYELSANQGNSTAQVSLGMLYQSGLGVSQDYQKAKYYYELSANQGNSLAQWLLGDLYQFGRTGVPQDYQKAKYYYELSANQGNSDAQWRLGILYNLGKGVPQDYQKAKYYYELSANQGNSDAQLELGILYYLGMGVPQDYQKAKYYYELSANQGNSNAQWRLGNLYALGMGVPKDYQKAKYYFELSANQGNSVAQWSLGTLYQIGLGVPQDYQKARYYYKLSADQGNTRGKELLESLNK